MPSRAETLRVVPQEPSTLARPGTRNPLAASSQSLSWLSVQLFGCSGPVPPRRAAARRSEPTCEHPAPAMSRERRTYRPNSIKTSSEKCSSKPRSQPGLCRCFPTRLPTLGEPVRYSASRGLSSERGGDLSVSHVMSVLYVQCYMQSAALTFYYYSYLSKHKDKRVNLGSVSSTSAVPQVGGAALIPTTPGAAPKPPGNHGKPQGTPTPTEQNPPHKSGL